MHATPLKKFPTGGVRNREHAKELHDGDSPAVSGVSVLAPSEREQ